uniref:Integrase core domain containing protein n=1 Tax=Solanum tuberosum TaxID=4113 RepID=M1DYI4_SOLTU
MAVDPEEGVAWDELGARMVVGDAEAGASDVVADMVESSICIYSTSTARSSPRCGTSIGGSLPVQRELENKVRKGQGGGGLEGPLMDLRNNDVGDINLQPLHNGCQHHYPVPCNQVSYLRRGQSISDKQPEELRDDAQYIFLDNQARSPNPQHIPHPQQCLVLATLEEPPSAQLFTGRTRSG